MLKRLMLTLKKNLEQNISVSDRNYPLYICEKDGDKYFIPVVGTGLWGPIGDLLLWNLISKQFMEPTDHKSETPGLGAEIRMLHTQTSILENVSTQRKLSTNHCSKDGSGSGMNSKLTA